MPLEKKLVTLPLAGQDAGSDPKMVAGLIRADNVHWARAGAAEKRFTAMWEWPYEVEPSFVISPTSGWYPLFVGSKNLKKWDADTYTFPTMDKSGLSNIAVTPIQGISDGYYKNVTYIEFGDFYLTTATKWCNYLGLGYSVFHVVETHRKATGQLVNQWGISVYPGEFVPGNETPCLRPVKLEGGGNTYIYYINYATKKINYIIVSTYDGTITNAGYEYEVTMPYDAWNHGNLDACSAGDGSTIYLTYVGESGGNSRPCIIAHGTAYGLFYGTVLSASTAAWRIGVWPYLDGSIYGCMVAWYELGFPSQTLYVLTVGPTGSIVRSKDGIGTPLDVVAAGTVIAATAITGIKTSSTFNRIYVGMRQYVTPVTAGIAKGRYEEAISVFGIISSSSNLISAYSFPLAIGTTKAQLISKPWLTTDNQLMVMTTAAGSTATLRDTDFDIFGRAMFEKYEKDAYMDGYISSSGFITDTFAGTDGYQRYMGAVRKEGVQYTFCKMMPDQSLARLRLTHGAMNQASVVDTIFIPNSNPYSWDGNVLVEQGFLDTPRYIDVTPETGGAMAVGKYWYQVMWSWTDANGALHRSVPSQASSVTLVAGKTAVDVRVPTCRSTRKAGVKIEIYRTQANNIEPRLLKTLENDQWLAGDYIDFEDDANDTYLVDKPAIYTYGGVIESVCPPSYWIHCVHQSRHFVVDKENPNTHIYYSKALVSATAIEHSDAFLIKVPPTGGHINAMVSMMDRLVVLKQDAIYVISGSGPDQLGAQASWSEPYTVSTSIGCDNSQSLVEVPDGIMFRSRQGIMLLSKSLQLSYVGEPVRYWTDNSITAGVVSRRDKSCVIWFFSSMFVSGGPSALVYNYKHGLWSVWSGAKLLCDSVNCCSNDRIWMVDDDMIRYSADNYWYDVDYPGLAGLTKYNIKMTLETGWIPLSGIGGFSRLYKIFFVGHVTSAAEKLHLKIAYDYDGYYSQAMEFNRATVAPFDFSAYYGAMTSSSLDGYGCILELVPPRQKCTAIKLKMYDDNDGYNQGWSASAFAFLIGVKPQGDQGLLGKVFTKTGG